MKKVILTSLMFVLVSMCMFAGSDLSVVQGDKKFFKTASGTATIEFEYASATYDDKKALKQKFDNIDELMKIGKDRFIETFNEKCKTVNIAEGASTANYKFILKVTKMDQYFKVMGFIPSNATKAWGTLSVVNTATNETVLVVEFKEVDGGANPSPDNSFGDCFDAIAKQFAKLK